MGRGGDFFLFLSKKKHLKKGDERALFFSFFEKFPYFFKFHPFLFYPFRMTTPLDSSKRFKHWQDLLAKEHHDSLFAYLKESPVVEVADFLSLQSWQASWKIMQFFPPSEQGALFEHLDEVAKKNLYDAIPKRDLARFFAYVSSDTRVDFYQKLTQSQRVELLPFLPLFVRKNIMHLSMYPQDTAGGIMGTDFVTLDGGMHVGEAMEKIRKSVHAKKMIYYLYVVNQEMEMLGFVSLRDLVTADLSTPITTLLRDTFIFSHVQEDRESVARKVEKYDLFALPVLNDAGQIVGIVSYDDAMAVMTKEYTEDMERIMGIMPDNRENSYLQISSYTHFRKRIAWIIGLFFLSFLSSAIMHHYDAFLKYLPIMSLYLTTINDAGGNAGSQTATVVIRSLSLGEVTLKNWLRIIFKELRVALMVATFLALLSLLKVLFFATFWEQWFGSHLDLPMEGLFVFSTVIGLSIALQVIVSTLIGASLPMIFTRFGHDPALAASPAITTLVDGTGLLIYFGIAQLLLSHSLGH